MRGIIKRCKTRRTRELQRRRLDLPLTLRARALLVPGARP
jgi:hypothetical protein